MTLKDLYRPVAAHLDEVSRQVGSLWTEALQLVHGPGLQPTPPGGKLLRPALCLMSAGASGARDLSRFTTLAAGMELLHLAALTHDDVIDGANMRRGMRSLNALWSDHAAILGGDYLVARSIALMTTYGSCEVVEKAIHSVREMAEAELRYFANGKGHLSVEDCIALARQKTASLFAATCSAPASLIEGAPADALHRYGLALGVAFQLIDDVLDLVQDAATLGKPSCADLVEGKPTVPLLLLRDALDHADAARLESMQGKPLDDADRAWVAAMLERSGAREKAESIARRYAEEARNTLATLAPGEYRDSMAGLAEFVLVRGS